MPLDPFHAKNLLDYTLGGAAASQPSNQFISLATASPTTASAFDGPFTRSGTAGGRATWNAAAAASPTGSATNRSLMTWTATAIATVVGWNLWNSSSGGSRLAFGTLSSSVGCASADTFGFAAGALKITMV